MSRRAELLEFAVLGLLHESPMHGYELRKRLNTALGAFRALSYGSLYPCLRQLLDKGWIQDGSESGMSALTASESTRVSNATKRARNVYELTAEGKEQFQAMLSQSGPASWEDDEFDVHFAFFARTQAEVRLRILEGRRSRLEERLAKIQATAADNRARMDAYTAELQRHGLERAEREVRWLDELIDIERTQQAAGVSTPENHSSTTPRTT